MNHEVFIFIAGILLIAYAILGKEIDIKDTKIGKPSIIQRIFLGALGISVTFIFIFFIMLSPQSIPQTPASTPIATYSPTPKPTLTLTQTVTAVSSKYDFENGNQGWLAKGVAPYLGVPSSSWTTERAHSGQGSLKLVCELISSDPDRKRGAVGVDLRQSPPEGMPKGLMNLEGKDVGGWVYAPSGAIGDPLKPNGIKLSFVDAKGFSCGRWQPVIQNTWFKINLTPSREMRGSAVQGEKVYTDPYFDPTNIAYIVIAFELGEGSTADFLGTIYIDDIGW